MTSIVELALNEIPRLLSLMDKNPASPTYGCFDRQYWCYRTRDYFNGRLQEACYALALVYAKKLRNNPWYKDKMIRECAIAAMRFWAKNQYADGSFDEYYPKEKGIVTTEFSAYCVAKAYLLLGIKDTKIVNALERAAEFVHRNDDLIVVNHDAGGAAMLYWVYKITRNKKYLEYCKEKLAKVLATQSREGWFPEYGGADIGYLSLTIYYLSDLLKIGGKKLSESLDSAIEFFSYFAHPDGSFGGQYGSRETSLIIPAGFFRLAVQNKTAASLAAQVEEGIGSKVIMGPYSFDDRYVAESLYPYLEECNLNSVKYSSLPKDSGNGSFEKYFEETGILVKEIAGFFAVLNLKKGGIGKIFKGKKLAMDDYGWVSEARKGGCTLTTNGKSTARIANGKIEISGKVYESKFSYNKSTIMIGVRFVSALGMGALVKKLVRKSLITKRKKSVGEFKREIRLSASSIEYSDKISLNKRVRFSLKGDFSDIYTTSLGLYEKNQLLEAGKKECFSNEQISFRV